MPNKFTEHYHLSQWEKTDQVLMEDFNEDNRRIDAALKAEADVNAALSASLTSEIQTRTALSSTVAKLGNCQIYTTTYTGKGTSGESNPVQLSFSYPPALVVVYAPNGTYILLAKNATTAYLNNTPITVSWNGNRVSWYATGTLYQMNVKDTVYQVVALCVKS